MSADQWTNPGILFIDDAPVHASTLERKLRLKGISPKMTTVCPEDWSKEFGGASLPSGKGWDAIDIVFVDLELSGENPQQELTLEGLKGGTVFLPEIRRRAPWLPVVSCSVHYQSGDRFILKAGLFPFDAHFPSELDGLLDHNEWVTFFRYAELNALVRAVGEEYRAGARSVDVRAVDSIFTAAGLPVNDAREVIERLFHTAAWVSLEPVEPGFSGACTYRAVVGDWPASGARRAEWLVKLSSSPAGLQREIDAHTRLQRAGVGVLRSVPLLWPTVVRSHSVAGIAYQFAVGTEDGRSFLKSHSIDELVSRARKLLLEFFVDSEQEVRPYGNVVSGVLPRAENLLTAIESLPTGASRDRLRVLASGDAAAIGMRSAKYGYSLLHGDLNLRNIMFGERDIMIDFANSSIGPIASDLAGLVASILVQHEPARAGVAFTDRLRRVEGAWIADLVEGLLKSDDDRLMFAELLAAYLAGALRWELDAATKKWIGAALPSSA